MPFIEIHYLEPRSEEQRERLAKAITDDIVEIFEVPREAVWIEFSEMSQSHFSKGGVLWNKR